MYCSRCGTQFPDTNKFCPSCGLEVGGLATTPVKAIATGEMTEMDMVKEALIAEYDIQKELGRAHVRSIDHYVGGVLDAGEMATLRGLLDRLRAAQADIPDHKDS